MTERKHYLELRGTLSAKYTIPISILILIIVALFYYNTSYLPSVQSQHKQPNYLEQHMNQIVIQAETPDNVTNIPRYCLSTNSSIACDYHWHIHLDILINQSSYIVIPDLLGHIDYSEYNLYAVHTHDNSGILHIECCSPLENITFTLGDIFSLWGYPVFNSLNCLTYHNQPVLVYVDGHLWNSKTQGPISKIPLLEHEEIAITVGTNPVPANSVPSEYVFHRDFRSLT